MSTEHDAIRRLYEAFSRRDLESICAEFAEGAEVDFTRTLGPDGGVYPGREGIERLLSLYWDAFEEISIEAERLVDGTEAVVALVVARGRGRTSGVAVEARGPHVWTFRDGKPVRFTLFQAEEEAFAAAGVTPG